VLAGAATGLRSTSAVAALISARAADPPAALTEPVAAGRQGSVSPASSNKKLSTPSRLTPVGLGGRVVFASLAGAVLGRRTKHAVLPAVIVASVAALVTATVGHDLRVAADERFGSPAPASVEDAVALSLAAAFARA